MALKRASIVLEREIDIYSLNGIIGGKNNIYSDVLRTRFLDFNDFFAQWLDGLNNLFENEKRSYMLSHDEIDWNYRGSFRTVRILKDPTVFSYTSKFLERNFYKHMDQRIRVKPEENLWSIWFGYKLTYGLLIAPVKRGDWANDKSEIRKAKYKYWTIGHIMSTGLIDPNLESPIHFNKLEDFLQFYQSVLKRLSNSTYEELFCDKYIEYLTDSEDVMNEPFLIPEFRYAGLTRSHEYRIDFTIFNEHTNEFVGFEISPASTHMSVKNLKDKQYEVNEDLKKKWEKEMSKRNDYFKTFGISIITFTDSYLTNVDKCFNTVKEKLKDRPDLKPLLSKQMDRLAEF